MTSLKGFGRSFTITPSDATDIGKTCQAIYVGVAGDITLIAADDPATSTAVLFKAVPAGLLYVSARRVKATGTTATNLVGLANN